jgi:hypothetical protein
LGNISVLEDRLGFEDITQTVSIRKHRGETATRQSWGTFLRNHAPNIAAMDRFVIPTIGFNSLFVLVIVRLARRELVWINVTAHPTAKWIAQQITEALSLERGSALPDSRPRWDLRCCCHAPATSHGHPRQAHRPWLAVAERLRRAIDRIDPT